MRSYFQCRLIWEIVGRQEPTVLAVGAVGVVKTFSLVYHFSLLSQGQI